MENLTIKKMHICVALLIIALLFAPVVLLGIIKFVLLAIAYIILASLAYTFYSVLNYLSKNQKK